MLGGFALAALMHDTIWASSPIKLNENLHWVVVFLVGLSWAIAFQLLMVGSQGLFAQVLPVPGGRSIRGGMAVLGGALIWLFVLSTSIARLLAGEQLKWVPTAMGVVGLLAAIGAVICYVWGWPTAVRDFADRK